jgi:hypothetical protein
MTSARNSAVPSSPIANAVPDVRETGNQALPDIQLTFAQGSAEAILDPARREETDQISNPPGEMGNQPAPKSQSQHLPAHLYPPTPESIFPQIMIRAALLPEPCRPDERGRFGGLKKAAFHPHILIRKQRFSPRGGILSRELRRRLGEP